MSWNYNDEPEVSNAPVIGAGDGTQAALPKDPQQAAIEFKQEADQIQALVPNEFSQLLNNPALSPEQKIALARELIELNKQPEISENDVSSASPEIRAAVGKMKEHKDQIAEQEKQLSNMLLGGGEGNALSSIGEAVSGVGSKAAKAEKGMSLGNVGGKEPLEYVDLGDTMQFLANLGPGGLPTPNVPNLLQGIGKGMGGIG
jgi:hypothetical protein